MNINWGDKTPNIALQIYQEKPFYAVKLMHAFNQTESEYLSDWYLHLHEAVEYILKNQKYRKTASTACIFAYRKLANYYRDTTRLKRQDPQKLWAMSQDDNGSAAVLYHTTYISLYSEERDEEE